MKISSDNRIFAAVPATAQSRHIYYKASRINKQSKRLMHIVGRTQAMLKVNNAAKKDNMTKLNEQAFRAFSNNAD